MSRSCQLFGTKVLVGNNVPKSNHKTKRVFLPNLHKMSFKSDILGKVFDMKVSVRAMRTILKHGSLDNYLLSAKARNLTIFAKNIRVKIKKKQVVATAAA